MKVEQISKERLGDKVLFPRTQFAGLTCEDKDLMPQRQDFDVELIHDVPKMGTVKLIVQQQSPHMVFQLFETKSEEQFDDFLGKLLGMHQSPIYISGRTDFIVLFQGNREDMEINQANYKDVIRRIHATCDAAARWWHLYGKE
jgi:hypothetical protein